MSGTRIKDRFTATGRKLTDAEKQAVADLHARYPQVTLKTVPPKRWYESKQIVISKCTKEGKNK